MASLPVDDGDLDDAALWAVIDSAAAAFSSTKCRKPPSSSSSSSPNFKSPPKPRILNSPSPSPSLPPLSKIPPHNSPPAFSYNDHRLFCRPHKILRSSAAASSSSNCVSDISATSSPDFMIVKQFPVNKLGFSSPISERHSPQLEYRVCDDEKENFSSHCLAGRFPTVSLFKDYQDAAMSILEKSDYTIISGNPFIKKSGWRKIAFYFNVSFEIRDKTIEFDENRNVQRAEFVARAYMQGGRFSDGWGSCERREKKFLKPNNDIPSTAETRAKNKACQDLIGIGQYRPRATHSHTPQ